MDGWGHFMMRIAAIAVILIGLLATPATAAQGKGKKNGRVPPGHLPQPGQCRVWYDGVPPGHQPGPTSCSEAERIAARERNARVIYGSDRGRRDRDDDRWERDDDRSGREGGRAVPRRDRYPGGYPDAGRYPDRRYPDRYPDRRGGYGYQSVPFENGRQDGLVKGREDARDRDRYDPARHGWYRSADRGYNSRYGSREDYRSGYREGFLAGYEEAYRRDNAGTRSGDRRPSWWPF